jgi:POT family proton-dependent oligopeptide transporter
MSAVIDVTTTTLDQPPILSDRSFFGHPKGLGLLFVVEMWERFSYYGMRALLVLYLVNFLKWPDADATHLYGTYTSLAYLTPLIGGYLADRFIGTHRSVVIGSIIIAMGHFALAFHSITMFYTGLALIIIGTGFFKPNVSTMVGQLYPVGDSRRDAGFTIFYMGINLGAAFAPLVCGTLGQSARFGWHYGFAAAGVGMVLGLITYLIWRNKYLPGIGLPGRSDPNNTAAAAVENLALPNTVKLSVLPGIIGAIVCGGAAYLAGATWMPIAMAVATGAVFAATVTQTHGEERKRVIALFILVFFVIFFWMAFEQAGSSMNLFADRYTNLNIGSFQLRSSWFQSVNAVCILIFAPVFASLWVKLAAKNREPSTPLKMVFGLTLLGLGFLFLVVGSHSVDACIAKFGKQAPQCAVASPMWLVLAYVLHTFGELCLSPVGLSYVTKIAPVRFASLLMGAWFLANAAANYLGGWLAGETVNIATQAKFFSIPVATSLGSALLLLLLVPLLKNLTKSVKA